MRDGSKIILTPQSSQKRKAVHESVRPKMSKNQNSALHAMRLSIRPAPPSGSTCSYLVFLSLFIPFSIRFPHSLFHSHTVNTIQPIKRQKKKRERTRQFHCRWAWIKTDVSQLSLMYCVTSFYTLVV